MKYKVASDYEFLVKVSKKKYKFYRENKAVYCFRLGGMSGRNYFESLKNILFFEGRKGVAFKNM